MILLNKVLLAYRIKRLRKAKSFTQLKMERLTGIKRKTYSKLENNRQTPTIEQLRKIALALDASIDYLIGLTDENKPYSKKNKEN